MCVIVIMIVVVVIVVVIVVVAIDGACGGDYSGGDCGGGGERVRIFLWCVRACVRAYGLCVRRVRVVGVSRGVWVCRVWCVGALCVLCGRVVRGRAGVRVMV